ncbi:MAG TPA: hypothetical protein PKD00_01130 [Burkholderiales bacterium]|nr:hypothetical protein [Burkholderiales bacterium]
MKVHANELIKLKQVNDMRKQRKEIELRQLNLQKNKLVKKIKEKNKIEEQTKLKFEEYKKNAFKELINQNITQNHIIKIDRNLESFEKQIEIIINEKNKLIDKLQLLERDILKIQTALKQLNIKQEKYKMFST